jgi:hypothetical protein
MLKDNINWAIGNLFVSFWTSGLVVDRAKRMVIVNPVANRFRLRRMSYFV